MDEVMEIRNPKFGKIRVLRISGYPWIVEEDVAEALGYISAGGAILQNVKCGDIWRFHDKDGEVWMVINKSAVFTVAMGSNHPKAGAFLQWLIDEVWSED